MFWSRHKYDKRLDKCSKANEYNFDIISHEELVEVIPFLCFYSPCQAI